MKRFFAGLLAVCLVGAAFAGCSGSSANYNVNDVASAVETVAKIENPLDITEDDLTYEFGVDMDKVEEFSGQKTGVANTAGTVLVVKASAGSVDDIKAALENYKNGLVSVSESRSLTAASLQKAITLYWPSRLRASITPRSMPRSTRL